MEGERYRKIRQRGLLCLGLDRRALQLSSSSKFLGGSYVLDDALALAFRHSDPGIDSSASSSQPGLWHYLRIAG